MPLYFVPHFAGGQPQGLPQDNELTTANTEHVQVGDINIAYKRFGQGKPILFISGTSQTKDAWDPTLLSQLAATNHTVIVFDNRGIGETTMGTKPFSIEQFANDTAGLLDALRVEKADVLGVSLGTFIVQELTLNYPQKVDKLILHAAYCGGNGTVYASGPALEAIMTLSSPQALYNMTAEQQAMILAQIMFPPEWLKEHPENIRVTPPLGATTGGAENATTAATTGEEEQPPANNETSAAGEVTQPPPTTTEGGGGGGGTTTDTTPETPPTGTGGAAAAASAAEQPSAGTISGAGGTLDTLGQ